MGNSYEETEYEFGTGSVFAILDDMAVLREERERAKNEENVYLNDTFSSPQKHSEKCLENIPKEEISKDEKYKKLKEKYKSVEDYKIKKGLKRQSVDKKCICLEEEKFKKYIPNTYVPNIREQEKKNVVIKNENIKENSKRKIDTVFIVVLIIGFFIPYVAFIAGIVYNVVNPKSFKGKLLIGVSFLSCYFLTRLLQG